MLRQQVVNFITTANEAVKELRKPQLNTCGNTSLSSKLRVCSKLGREEKKIVCGVSGG